MKEWLQKNIGLVFGRRIGDSNTVISQKQKLIVKIAIGILLLIVISLVIFIQEKTAVQASKTDAKKQPLSKIELPDTTIDTERRWREHFENTMDKQNKELLVRLQSMEEEQEKLLGKASSAVERELRETKIKLEMAQAELINASLELKKVAGEEAERANLAPTHKESSMVAQEFAKEVEFDRPKSAENYISEGTYFTGNLLGGIVVSTALNTPDENATPVAIRLTGRGNLHASNKLDISKCRIMGSAYGDISSERAIIRLEKLICEVDGLYQTSRIAGQIFGPDGYNGIKGRVVATSTKHIKNAMIGGMISGLSNSANSQQGMSITSSGIITSQKRGVSEMLGQGAMQGVSSAGEKLADYYLRQAELMSPVLTIDSGVRVNAQITKGFFVGEISTHRKIKQSKK